MSLRVALAPSNQIGNEYRGHPGVTESAVMKEVADAAAARLVALGHEAKVFHRPGGLAELRQMAADVNAWGADVVVSPHSNAAAGYELGVLTIAYNEDRAAWGKRLGTTLAAALGSPFRASWTNAGFIVLNATTAPALIVEIHTHDTAVGVEALLGGKETIGRALADAVLVSLGVQPEPAPEPEHPSRSGLFVGDTDGRFNWAAALTRDQADVLFERLITRYGLKPVDPGPGPVSPGVRLDTPVAGVVDMTVQELASRVPAAGVYDALVVARSYRDWCHAFGIRLDVAWCQMLLETNGLRYGGQVVPSRDRHNFCGLKNAAGTGYASFETIDEGVIAHVAHLAAYALPTHVHARCSRASDPRHPESHQAFQAEHGTVRTVSDLGSGRWAEDPGYAAKLVRVWERGL